MCVVEALDEVRTDEVFSEPPDRLQPNRKIISEGDKPSRSIHLKIAGTEHTVHTSLRSQPLFNAME